jgi:hypothetical protein
MKVLIAFKDLRFQDLLVDDEWDGMDGMGWMDGWIDDGLMDGYDGWMDMMDI